MKDQKKLGRVVKIGKKNQLYAKWVRIMTSVDDPNEIYLVLRKDTPMERKYIRQFDNMFAGKDVILTIGLLIRGKNETLQSEEEMLEKETEKKKVSNKKGVNLTDTLFWSVPEE